MGLGRVKPGKSGPEAEWGKVGSGYSQAWVGQLRAGEAGAGYG